jgi:magnesium chelatase family protein
MLVAAMNPCPCGNLTDPRKACRCRARDIDRYRQKISQPILDRIDIHIEVPPAEYRDISGAKPGESSEAMRQRVTRARTIQGRRFGEHRRVYTNSQLPARILFEYCRPDRQGMELLRSASARLGLSARSYTKILRVSRTIADMEASESIKTRHLAEAIQYRTRELP